MSEQGCMCVDGANRRVAELEMQLARSAGCRVAVDEAKPAPYTPVWTDLGAMVWDGRSWRKPFSEHPAVRTTWEIKRLARLPDAKQPTWWLQERQ